MTGLGAAGRPGTGRGEGAGGDRGQQVGDGGGGLPGGRVGSGPAGRLPGLAAGPGRRAGAGAGQDGGRAGVGAGGGRGGGGQVQGGGLGAQPAGGRAPGRVGGQRSGQQLGQRGGDAGQVGLAGDDPVEDGLVGLVAAAEGRAAGGRVGQRGAPGVDVGGRAARPALDDLRGQVAGRAHDQAGLGQPGGVRGLGDAEVDHHRAVIGEQHVARLQVAVHDAGGVDGGQRLGRAVGEQAQARAGQRPAGADHRLQGRPGHVPGDDVGELAGHVGVQDLGHERAADPAHGLDLAGQPEAGVDVLGGVGPQHLDGHQAALRVAGEVNHPHAAFPEAVLKAVRAESSRQSIRRRHRESRVRNENAVGEEGGGCRSITDHGPAGTDPPASGAGYNREQ